METILEILKYVLPSIVVFFTAYYVMKIFLDVEDKKRLLQFKMDAKTATIPVRLQAFERLTLYLERINVTNMVIRIQHSGLNNAQYQMLLVSTIRNEFDHNLSQQMYISTSSWEAIKAAKEESIKIINLAAGQLASDGQAAQLATKIIEITADEPLMPSDKALEILKKEIRQYF